MPAAIFNRLLPRPEDRDALFNILALLALPLLVFVVLELNNARTYFLDVVVLADHPAMLGAEVDLGKHREQDGPLAVRLIGSPHPQRVRFKFPACHLCELVLHAAASANVRIGTAVFYSAQDDLLAVGEENPVFRAADYRLAPSMANPMPRENGFRAMAPVPETAEAALALPLDRPLVLGFGWRGLLLFVAVSVAEYVLISVALLLAWRRVRDWPAARAPLRRVVQTGERLFENMAVAVRAHPVAAIWIAAALGVVVSCYPVIFFGKSFVSPNIGATMLYDRFPTLPGNHESSIGDGQGSDVLATMSGFVPYAVVQRHSLLADHEFPIFDRYNQCGLPLLAQGQTMIGDPLHLLMLLAGANAWAWDMKFLLARLLFAAGAGLIVRLTTRQTAVALLLAFSSCFLGFFEYRLNHPTYFSLCYAPWILYAWLRLPGAAGLREAAPGIALLLAADWMEINSGPVKDACMLVVSLNLCGLLVLLLSGAQPLNRRLRVLGFTLWCEAALLLVSNPFWVSALDLVVHSWNIYLTPRLWQIQPNLLIGFFDDIFYRQFEAGERLFSPCVNFVVFLGLAFAVSRWKVLVRDAVFVGVSIAAAAAAAVAFGIVPPSFIEKIPFLANILHVDDTFSTILIVPAIVLAGFGLAECRRRFSERDWTLDYLGAVAVLVFLAAIFLGTTQAQQRSAIHSLGYNEEIGKSFFFWCDACGLCLAFILLPLLVRRLGRPDGRSRWALAPWVAVCVAAMLWRHGQQLHFAPGLDRYVSRPQARADFYGRSPAVDYIRGQLHEPGRALGMQNNLYPGTSGMFGLEGISGSDAMLIPAYHTLLATQLKFEWGWRPLIDKQSVEQFKAMYDMLNVRYYLGAPGGHDIPVAGVSRVAKMDLDVFESRDVWPRAFYTSALSTFDKPRDLLDEVGRNVGHPFAAREAAWPQSSLPPGTLGLPSDQSARVVAPATNYRLTDNTTAFDVTAPGPGVVVLTEVYNGENQQVTVNGRPTAHFPVNLAFDGVYLDHAGTFTIRVREWPRFLTGGLYASALGVVLLAATAAVVYRPLRRRYLEPVRLPSAEMAAQC